MPASITLRSATVDERAAMEKFLANAPTTALRFKQGAENALVMWAASLLGVIVVWLVLGWLAGKALGMDLGLQSRATLWVLGIATPACAGLGVISSIRWVRNWSDHRPLLRQDLAASKVNQEHYVFTEAKRFQEPEHGGLMYFLRSSEHEVFTVFDLESQNLALDDKDPLRSSYQPQTNLLIVRAPKSGFVISSQSSGPPLTVGAPIELAGEPKDWPEPENLCGIPWSQLEERLGPRAAASAARRGDA